MTAVSSERFHFQVGKPGVYQEPPLDGAQHLTVAEAEEGCLCTESCLHGRIKQLAFVGNLLSVRKAGDEHGHFGISPI